MRAAATEPSTALGRWPAVLAWSLWALTLLGVAPVAWLDDRMRQAGRPELVQLTAESSPFVLAMVSAATVGAVLGSRRPRHPVGWLLLGFGLSVLVEGGAYSYAHYGLLVRPGAAPAASYAGVLSASGSTFLAWPTCIGFVLLLTPTGSLPSPRWRWWAWCAAAAPVAHLVAWAGVATVRYPDPPYLSVPNPLVVPAVAPLRSAALPLYLLTLLGVVLGGASLVVRFRRARAHGQPLERQQLRWVAFAAAFAGVGVPVAVVGVQTGRPMLTGWGIGAYAVVLCLAIGAAILRYRLYDLDRIISRTLAYALLTLLLGAGYAAVVVGLGQLLGQQRSSLAVAGATLAVAAGFQPARRRTQTLVDRRFNRHRYDAGRTVQAFSARLRQQVDLDALTTDLLAVVDQTVQPTRAALWLRPSNHHTPPATNR